MTRGELTPEAELHFTRGLLHLRRGESILPYGMTIREDKAPPGADVLAAVVGLAAVAASRAMGQTRWIEEYRAEMRTALTHFDAVAELAPEFAENHFRRSQTLRYLGQTAEALIAARRAVALEPGNEEYASFLSIMDGGAVRRTTAAAKREEARPLTWDDVILPERTKRDLRQIQRLLENPAQARSLGVEPPTGLLLYGPPGTGKTTIARVLAAQAKCRFLTTTPAETNQMWMGESEKAVARLFTEARNNPPAIIFLDEIDALIPVRTGGVYMFSDKVVNQFLQEMDGLTGNTGVFVIGATNRPDMLDPALLRGGRLSRQMEIPLPDRAARRAILALHTRIAQLDESVNLDRLADEAEGFSGADLRALVNEAGMQALIRLEDEGGTKALIGADFDRALENLGGRD